MPRRRAAADHAGGADAIRAIADAHSTALDDDDLDALGYDDWISGFEPGSPPTTPGMVPPLKEAVEEASPRAW